jgi:hypothetical protein
VIGDDEQPETRLPGAGGPPEIAVDCDEVPVVTDLGVLEPDPESPPEPTETELVALRELSSR